jgi:hypothetical protein
MTPAPPCPYCSAPRVRGRSGELRLTCGVPACRVKATAAGILARGAADRNMLHWPARTGKIDFQNGFASQNLSFAPDRTRLRT